MVRAAALDQLINRVERDDDRVRFSLCSLAHDYRCSNSICRRIANLLTLRLEGIEHHFHAHLYQNGRVMPTRESRAVDLLSEDPSLRHVRFVDARFMSIV